MKTKAKISQKRRNVSEKKRIKENNHSPDNQVLTKDK